MTDIIKDYQNQIVEISKNYSIFGTPEAIKVYGLGLCEEVGEVLGLLKRYYRGDDSVNSEEFKIKLCKELGDVTAYLALVLHSFNFKFDVAYIVDYPMNNPGNSYFNGLNLSKESALIADFLIEFELNGANQNEYDFFKNCQQFIYFLCCIADDFDLTLDDVLLTNINKLTNRVFNNTLVGTGSDR